MVTYFEDICPEIRSAIGNKAFDIGIGITLEQEGNASGGHLPDDGVLVDVVGDGGSWVEDRVQVDRILCWASK